MRINQRQARSAIHQLRPFDSGNVRGVEYAPYAMGILPQDWRTWVSQNRAAIVYTVYSYKTPIAFLFHDVEDTFGRGVWVVPPVKYSVSTSRHQDLCPGHGAKQDMNPTRAA